MVFSLFTPSSIICLFTPFSKTMYDISPTKDIVSLENTDVGPFCGTDGLPRWSHRMECHKASYEAACKRNAELGRSTPEMKKKCRTGWSSKHCECYTRHMRLHRRIKSWMPRNLHYCGTCEMFTERKKQHNGRCELFYVKVWSLANWRRLSRPTKTTHIRGSLLDTHFQGRCFRA